MVMKESGDRVIGSSGDLIRTAPVSTKSPDHPIARSPDGVAVLALQGDFQAHRRLLARMGIDSFEAKRPEQIEEASGLIIPGGESTTIWKFFETAPWGKAIRRFAASGPPGLATCAGGLVPPGRGAQPVQHA